MPSDDWRECQPSRQKSLVRIHVASQVARPPVLVNLAAHACHNCQCGRRGGSPAFASLRRRRLESGWRRQSRESRASVLAVAENFFPRRRSVVSACPLPPYSHRRMHIREIRITSESPFAVTGCHLSRAMSDRRSLKLRYAALESPSRAGTRRDHCCCSHANFTFCMHAWQLQSCSPDPPLRLHATASQQAGQLS